MSRIINNKLVKASGGWEHFLYETLKEVLNVVRDCGDGVCVDALGVIAAYEETER